MKISIITPNFNSGNYLENTILSVLNIYKNDFEIEYILVDGMSTDISLEIINKYRTRISKIIIEKDNGMYDALSKAFSYVTGDYICYINSGDIILPTSICSVLEYLKTGEKLITCRKLIMDDNMSVKYNFLPSYFFKNNIIHGFNAGSLEFIQQESTIFSSELVKLINFKIFSSLRYAGDYYIWHTFAKNNIKPTIVDTIFGVFRKHDGQLSSNKQQYSAEISKFIHRPRLIHYFYYLFSLINISIYRSFKLLYKKLNKIR